MYVHGFGFLCAGKCHNQCLEEHSEGRCECRDNSGCADGHFCSGDPHVFSFARPSSRAFSHTCPWHGWQALPSGERPTFRRHAGNPHEGFWDLGCVAQVISRNVRADRTNVMDALLMDLKDQDSVGCGECLRCAPGCDCIYDVCDRYGLDEGAVCFHEPACDVCKQACADGPPGSDCRDSCDGSAACGTEAPTVVSKCTRFGGAVDGTDTDGVSPPEPYAAPLVRRPLPPRLAATSDMLR